MQIISDGKINNVVIQQPLFEVQGKSMWDTYVEMFLNKINFSLESSGRKPWTLRQVAIRLRMARVKEHHIVAFYNECEKDRNFSMCFFSKTKLVWKQTTPNY